MKHSIYSYFYFIVCIDKLPQNIKHLELRRKISHHMVLPQSLKTLTITIDSYLGLLKIPPKCQNY